MSTPIIILAGGKSTRMGTDKTRLLYTGETLLRRAYRRFSEVFDDVYISANGDTGVSGARVIRDIRPGLGPISGLHASLLEFESVFLVAADMPFSDPETAKSVIENGKGGVACAAASNGRSEPLFAFYTRGVMPEVEKALENGDYSLHRLLSRVGAELMEVDPEVLVNINRPEDYEKLNSHIELYKI